MADLTERQRDLYRAVKRMSSDVAEQNAMIYVCANRVGAAEKDVKAVRALLLADHVKERSS